tara:strand:- start:36 stop:1061 length:1026 start_codon:yes stop_codon:yes gene_type:complete
MIINGAMQVAQRGTSQASITSSGYYTVDRWRTGVSNAGTWTQTQSTDVPSAQGFFNSTKLDCTTDDASLGAGDIVYYTYRSEGQNLQYLKKGTSSAESLTLLFWVKSNKTGTYICELQDSDNNRSTSKSYTISSADTWEKKTITFDGDTTGAFDNDNARSLDLNFWLVAGSNHTSGTLQTSWNTLTDANRAVGQVNLADSTSNEWYITGVQLEAGQTATPFEQRTYGEELALCRRYLSTFRKDGGGNTAIGMGIISGTTTISFIHLTLPVEMRTTPTLTVTTPTSSSISEGAADRAVTSQSINSATKNNCLLSVTHATGTAAGTPVRYVLTDTILLFSAEL